jgi:hypothetical protein
LWPHGKQEELFRATMAPAKMADSENGKVTIMVKAKPWSRGGFQEE